MELIFLGAVLIELPRYSDKYRPSPAAQPTLKRKEMHQPFFPSEIFEDYFHPKRRKKGACLLIVVCLCYVNGLCDRREEIIE